MPPITTTVVYENGVLRPNEKLDLTERRVYQAIILPIYEPQQQTLTDVLSFDPSDQQAVRDVIEKQRQALNAFVRSATTNDADDASARHDEYLYGTDS
jgi:predicted DNA-binding antitoxin AbrB/MazE fold protein